jgi:hypothetical protein
MRKFLGLLVALSLILVVPAPVSAQENAGEDEYTEGVPGGGGETPNNQDPAGSGAGSPLPPSIASQFEDAGAAGVAAAALAESGTQGASSGNASSGNSAGDAGSAGAASQGDSPVANATEDGGLTSAVKEVLDPGSDSGLGIWLPIILGLALAAALVAGFTRFRNSRTPA